MVGDPNERLVAELQRQLRESESRLALLVAENNELRERSDLDLRRLLRLLRPTAGRLKRAAKRGVRRVLR